MKSSTLEKIDRIPLRERVYHLVQHAIVSGELLPGQRVRDLDLATQNLLTGGINSGTDGRQRMSKTVGNIIGVTESPEVMRKQVMSMVTDVKRPRMDQPGHPRRAARCGSDSASAYLGARMRGDHSS